MLRTVITVRFYKDLETMLARDWISLKYHDIQSMEVRSHNYIIITVPFPYEDAQELCSYLLNQYIRGNADYFNVYSVREGTRGDTT